MGAEVLEALTPSCPARCSHALAPPPAPTRPAVHGLHTPRFTLDEGVLKLGAALHTALASKYLERWHARQGGAGGDGAREEL